MSKVGRLLRTFRKRMQLTQRELANLANVSESYVSYVESGGPFKPSREKINILASVLNLAGEDLALFVSAAGYTREDLEQTIPAALALPEEVVALPGLLDGDQLTEEEKRRLLTTLEAVINTYIK